jgi:hypothetical protein
MEAMMQLVHFGNPKVEGCDFTARRRGPDRILDINFRALVSGTENAAAYRVALVWGEVEKLIVEFAAMKEPSALALQQDMSLGRAARASGWIPK